MIKLNHKSKRLLLLQRNELLSDKQKWLRRKFGRFLFTNLFINFSQNKDIEKITGELFQKEIDIIRSFLPTKAENIIDIGCGLGIINIFLNKIYNNKTNFYLLDKNRIDSKIRYGFSSNYESYNDLNETKKLLLDNNISKDKIQTINVESEIIIDQKIDLVISLKSMGYHYPLDEYLGLFSDCCKKDTTFIFDVTEGYYDKSLLKKYFEEVQVIYEEKSIHSLKRVCCKNFIY